MICHRVALRRAGFALSVGAMVCAPVAAQTPRGVYVYSWNIAATSPPPPVCTGTGCPTTEAQTLSNALAVPGVDGLTLVVDWSLIEPRPGVFQWNMPANAWSSLTTYVRGDAVTDVGQVYLSLVNDNHGVEPSSCVPCARWIAIGSSPDLLDQWIAAAAAAGRTVNLAIRAGGGDTGFATPCWLFTDGRCGVDFGGAATVLPFDVSAHQGAGRCYTSYLAAPWDNFTAPWDAMLQNLSAHLQSTAVGGTPEYATVSMVRLTGINRTTDEFRLPEEILSTTDNCPSGTPLNAIDTWWNAQPRYDYGLLQTAWSSILSSFRTYFGDRYLNLPIIPNNTGNGQGSGETQYPFPEIGPGGCIYSPPVDPTNFPPGAVACPSTLPDLNLPLLQAVSSSQSFPGQFALEFESLPSVNTPANPYIVASTDPSSGSYLNAAAAFMTNVFLGSQGAACTGRLGSPTPCDGDGQYLELLNTGIYLPTPDAPTFRSQFVEVFAPNVVGFPCAISQAHVELTDFTPPTTTATVTGPSGRRGWYRGPVTVTFTATDNSYATPNGCEALPGVTQYSLDDGATWVDDSILTLNNDGIHTILFRSYRSEPLPGDLEATQSLTVKIDSTPPVVTASNSTATPPNGLLRVAVAGRITDNLSGVNRHSARYAIHDDFGFYASSNTPITVARDGTYSFVVMLPRYAGDAYHIRVTARDQAGNKGLTVTIARD